DRRPGRSHKSAECQTIRVQGGLLVREGFISDDKPSVDVRFPCGSELVREGFIPDDKSSVDVPAADRRPGRSHGLRPESKADLRSASALSRYQA
ncbi:hypothetical protein, partial [Pseudomonas avellanae]|uniref:hypothetical protein n=1 Tax=Pseudomonas avellanae TaxID=46257 RepID=UPI0019D6D532